MREVVRVAKSIYGQYVHIDRQARRDNYERSAREYRLLGLLANLVGNRADYMETMAGKHKDKGLKLTTRHDLDEVERKRWRLPVDADGHDDDEFQRD